MLARLARAGPALLALQPLTLRVLPKAKVAAIGIWDGVGPLVGRIVARPRVSAGYASDVRK